MLSLDLTGVLDRSWLVALGVLAACNPRPVPTGDTDGTSGTTGGDTTTTPTSSATDAFPPQCDSDLDCGWYGWCEDGMCEGPSHGPPCVYEECCRDDQCSEHPGGVCDPFTYDCMYPDRTPQIPLPVCAATQPDRSQWELSQAPSALGLGDFDGDGDLDVFAALPAGAAIELAFNDGAGTFAPGEIVDVGPPQSELQAAAADLDGDGDLDLAVARPDTSDLLVLFRQDGAFTPGPVLPTAAPPGQVAAIDRDGDGDVELLAFGGGFDLVSTWVGDGLGGFVARQPFFDLDGAVVSTVHRVNPDDRPDLLTLHAGGDAAVVKLFVGSEDLSWQSAQQFALDVPGWSQALAGELGEEPGVDLLAVRSEIIGGRARVWRRAADTMLWNNPLDYLSASQLAGGQLADGTADGNLDFIAATGGPTVSVLVGMSDASFSCERIHEVEAPTAPEVLVAGELDGDAGAELVVGSRKGPSVTVFNSL